MPPSWNASPGDLSPAISLWQIPCLFDDALAAGRAMTRAEVLGFAEADPTEAAAGSGPQLALLSMPSSRMPAPAPSRLSAIGAPAATCVTRE
jgi:hypothetical protein